MHPLEGSVKLVAIICPVVVVVLFLGGLCVWAVYSGKKRLPGRVLDVGPRVLKVVISYPHSQTRQEYEAQTDQQPVSSVQPQPAVAIDVEQPSTSQCPSKNEEDWQSFTP